MISYGACFYSINSIKSEFDNGSKKAHSKRTYNKGAYVRAANNGPPPLQVHLPDKYDGYDIKSLSLAHKYNREDTTKGRGLINLVAQRIRKWAKYGREVK